jgi:hypothetical protein
MRISKARTYNIRFCAIGYDVETIIGSAYPGFGFGFAAVGNPLAAATIRRRLVFNQRRMVRKVME